MTKYRGGVIFSAVGLLLLLTMVILLMLERSWTQAIFTASSTSLYEARIMKEMFLSEIQQSEVPKKGSRRYNLGTLDYQQTEDSWKIDVWVRKRKYKFIETRSETEDPKE